MPRGDPNRNLVAALSYLLGFVTGVVILLVEKDDKYIRFHAMQSVIVFGGLFIINIVLGLILPGILTTIINTVIFIVFVIIWLVSMIKAYQGQVFKWPIAGKFAEKRIA